jgi:hypothetical protein
MKRIALVALVCLSAVGIAAGSGVAANSNAPAKATGDVWFVNPYSGNVPAHWVFNAISGSTAKGNVSYDDPTGSYTGKVTSVSVTGNAATFTAEVTSSTLPGAAVGSHFTWTVTDVSEPGVGQDYLVGVGDGFTTPHFTITAGNIQVQS